MPKGSKLTNFEKGQISALYSQNFSLRRIATEIGRSDKVVRNYLDDPDGYGTCKSSGRPAMLSPRDKRRIVNAASNSTVSSVQIVKFVPYFLRF